MSKMIQIRDVPDDIHRMIKARAARAGMSLSDYLKRDIERQVARPAFDEFDEMVRADPPAELSGQQIVQLIHEGRREL